MAQQVKLLFATLISHIEVWVQAATVQLHIWLLADVLGKAGEDGPSAWTPATMETWTVFQAPDFSLPQPGPLYLFGSEPADGISLSVCLHVCGFHCLFLCHSPCQINIKTCMMEQAFDLAVNIWAAWISHQNNWVWEATKLLNLVSHQCWHWKAEVMAQVIKFLASPWDTWIAIPAPCSSSEQCWPLQECGRMNELKGIYWLSVT